MLPAAASAMALPIFGSHQRGAKCHFKENREFESSGYGWCGFVLCGESIVRVEEKKRIISIFSPFFHIITLIGA